MGIVIAKFRKKPSTFDVLSKLENEIISIEEFQKRTQQTQRKIVFRFLILAILIYAALAFLLYLYFSQISQNQKLLWSIPLIAFPLVIWLIKKFLTWYYNRKIKKNEKKLVSLKEKKTKILENVMETETYKVAKQILDKFANEPKKTIISTPQVQRATPLPTTGQKTFDTVLRQRHLATQSALRGRASFGGSPEPVPPFLQRQLALPGNRGSMNLVQTPSGPVLISPAQTPALPRRILPRDRSVLDKMVDYLIGDGPSNRYALICQNCHNHNGMALKEEFEYLSFNCGYCKSFNPARKKRPVGPKFDSPLMLTSGESSRNVESSDSERNSENDSDSDVQPIIEEPRSDSPDTARTSDFERVSDSELLSEDVKPEIDNSQEQWTAKDTSAEVIASGDAVDNPSDVSNK